jgi:uncharacterized phage-associated protein
MLTAQQVADFFLANRDDEDGLTHLKLQKLCYYAQAFHLALFGSRLFNERIVAWEHGPVVRSVWDRFAYRRGVLPRPDGEEDEQPLPREMETFLDRIYREYGQFSAWRLRLMTHEERPWIEAWAGDRVLSDETMESYFKEKLGAGPTPPQLSTNQVKKLLKRPEHADAIEQSRADFARGAFRET